jgi:2-polyprenyl-3-methyl-5-hydroxy-6-metoxy-1,4-benzoquinol methylase
MTLEMVACASCASDRSDLWGEENGFRAVKCRDCGLVYVNPRPSTGEITEGNKLGEHKTTTGSLDVLFGRSEKKVRHYERMVRRLFAAEIRVGRPITWLDVGAGYGELVEALRNVLPKGSVVLGIEPMLAKAATAVERGLPVRTLTLTEVDQSFDVVSLINVLSHLPNVPEFLSAISAKVKPGGTVLLETGNGGDLRSAKDYPDILFLPDHLMFAGVGHVKGFLTRSGFEAVETHSARRDTLAWTVKNVVKRLLGRPVKLGLPYRSPFRTVFFKARLKGPVVA